MKPTLSEDSLRIIEGRIERPEPLPPKHVPKRQKVPEEAFARVAQNVRKHREKPRRS